MCSRLNISSMVIGNFWGKYAGDVPSVAVMEVDRRCIRLNHAKMQYFMAAGDDFSFTLREQTPTPCPRLSLSTHESSSHSPLVRTTPTIPVPYRHQGGMPILLIHRKRSRCPNTPVNFIDHCRDDCANGTVLLGPWSSYEHVNHPPRGLTIGILIESRCFTANGKFQVYLLTSRVSRVIFRRDRVAELFLSRSIGIQHREQGRRHEHFPE